MFRMMSKVTVGEEESDHLTVHGLMSLDVSYSEFRFASGQACRMMTVVAPNFQKGVEDGVMNVEAIGGDWWKWTGVRTPKCAVS